MLELVTSLFGTSHGLGISRSIINCMLILWTIDTPTFPFDIPSWHMYILYKHVSWSGRAQSVIDWQTERSSQEVEVRRSGGEKKWR